jgi:hypothetical protein
MTSSSPSPRILGLEDWANIINCSVQRFGAAYDDDSFEAMKGEAETICLYFGLLLSEMDAALLVSQFYQWMESKEQG